MIAFLPLPFSLGGLEPTISAKTMDFHYNKHYKGYVTKTNELILNTPFENLTLEEIIKQSENQEKFTTLFNNSAQSYNHSFFWNSLTPQKKETLPPELLRQIDFDFGSLDNLKKQFLQACLSQFGSGWGWLVWEEKKFKIFTTSNAKTPLTNPNQLPILCIDVWEHAYYLDYQNRRSDFVQGILNNCLNWDFAYQNWNKRDLA